VSTAPLSSRNDLVDRARELSVELAEHAAATETLGRPAPESMKALEESGLLALTVPRIHGGPAADLGTQVRVALELGRGCASTAWVVSLSNSAKSMIGPMLAEQAQVSFYADPNAVVSASGVGGGRAVREADGLRVSGRWRMASGCELATWVSLRVAVQDEQVQVTEAGLAIVPGADLTIDRSWRSVGMQGTGSYTVIAENVFVPLRFTAVGPIPAVPGPPPARVSLGAIAAHLAPMVGATQAALDGVRAGFSGSRVPSATTYSRMVDSPMARHWFARAERAVQGAVRDTLAVADHLDRAAPGAEPAPQVRSGWRMDLAAAGTACRRALDDLLDLQGAGGFSPDEALQRTWRDVAVGTRYAGLNPYIADEDHARALLDAGSPVSTM
jgi:alkylation response protein AidB-like acyl-CoA dehydrogenase